MIMGECGLPPPMWSSAAWSAIALANQANAEAEMHTTCNSDCIAATVRSQATRAIDTQKFRRDVRKVHALGVRPLAELIRQIVERRTPHDQITQLVEQYARLAELGDFIEANDTAWSDPLFPIDGGRE